MTTVDSIIKYINNRYKSQNIHCTHRVSIIDMVTKDIKRMLSSNFIIPVHIEVKGQNIYLSANKFMTCRGICFYVKVYIKSSGRRTMYIFKSVTVKHSDFNTIEDMIKTQSWLVLAIK